MGALTEAEIFDCLATNFRLAAEDCDKLAVSPRKGAIYDEFRKRLRLIEGACRQASAWREDTRWLPIGKMMAECHQKAGNWLRGYKDPKTHRRIAFAPGEQNTLYVMLAANLRALAKFADDLRTKATGRVGMILPAALPAPHRETKPVGWIPTSSGLLVPDAAVAGHA